MDDKTKMKRLDIKAPLFLEDFAKSSTTEVRDKIAADFGVRREVVDEFQILCAYMSVGDYGCDSSAWLLLRRRDSAELFEVHGSHCSCYGFEENGFNPEPTTREYLKSDKFSFSCGGYDSDEATNRQAVKDFLKKI